MPPQSQGQGQAGPEQPVNRAARRAASRSERVGSSRAQRKQAAAEAERRKRWMIAGGAVAVVLIAALVYFLATRPQDIGPPVLAAEALPPEIPVQGMAMGPEDAPVTVVEWGDYT